MFDRTVIVHRSGKDHHNHYHKIEEKRAPTDESVRLLREMDAAARSEVLNSIKVGDAVFECVIHSMRDLMSSDLLLRAVFSLNGKNMTADVKLPHKSTPQAAFEALVHAVADRLATEAIRPAFRDLMAARLA